MKAYTYYPSQIIKNINMNDIKHPVNTADINIIIKCTDIVQTVVEH